MSHFLAQYKGVPASWAQTQELLDGHFRLFLSRMSSATLLRNAASSFSTAANTTTSGAEAAQRLDDVAARIAAVAASAPPALAPYLTLADQVEVSFAAMLADLCNMAYDVESLDPSMIEARHRLSIIATSLTTGTSCRPVVKPGQGQGLAADAVPPGGVPEQLPDAEHVAEALAQVHQIRAGNIVSFTLGGSPPLSPSISMLQLTSPEAVTAALTSQGHGSAFANPVYVSTLHPMLTGSLGSCDDEGDISDLEWRAAMVAAAPRGLLGVAAARAAAAAVGMGVGVGSLGTMGSIDGLPVTLLPQYKAAVQQFGKEALQPVIAVQLPPRGGSAGGAAGTLFSDVSLSEEGDFVSGQLYGYMTPLVERRSSSDGGVSGGSAAVAVPAAPAPPAAAVTQRGAAGGRALRREQEEAVGRRRRSSAGGAGEADGGAAAAAAALAGGAPVVVACTKAPPSAWFACDDKLTRTRYFAIQGSTSLEHWQINLQFEPVMFEDPKYGVRVHRGVYEAAKSLYDDLLPLVREHLASSPFATVSFTGHSLGGSLGTVLTLLLLVRGELKASQVSPVYTYGAPAVFCQGAATESPADRCAHCDLRCEKSGKKHARAHAHAHAAEEAVDVAEGDAAPTRGLLATLGLSDDQVVNVIMHKDVVPRAFVCDYQAVAGVLSHWVPAIREALRDGAGGRPGGARSLYNFVGRVAVLRPCADLPFVNGPADAAHPMLPNHPALYRVGLPDDWHAFLPDFAAASFNTWDELLDGTALGAAVSAVASGCRRGGLGAAAAAKRAAKLANMHTAMAGFMNQPHPLSTLADYQAYGPNGAISRFHNPDHYTRALNALLGR